MVMIQCVEYSNSIIKWGKIGTIAQRREIDLWFDEEEEKWTIHNNSDQVNNMGGGG